MTTQTNDDLEQVIRQAGEDWLIDWYAPRSEAMPHLRRIIQSIDDCAKRRFPGNVRITENLIVEEYRRNPQRIHAFLQAMGSIPSPDMLLMVWRILQGIQIREVSMSYKASSSFQLHVKLAPSAFEDRDVEEYVSNNIKDAAILRHFSTSSINDMPFFDGFYALRIN